MSVGAGPFELAGDVVSLRDFEPEDEDDFVAWSGFEEMYTYMHWRLDDPEAARKEFHRLLEHPSKAVSPRRFWYLAMLNAAGSFVGICGIDHPADARVEFGWFLSPPWWGRGYATAATALITRFAFEELGAAVVMATCDPENLGSRRVLEKNGLTVVAEEEVETWRGPRPRLRLALERSRPPG